MTKFTIFNVTIKIDVRTFINKISFTIYASFVLVTTIIFFKNRSVLKTNQFTAPSTQVSFVHKVLFIFIFLVVKCYLILTYF